MFCWFSNNALRLPVCRAFDNLNRKHQTVSVITYVSHAEHLFAISQSLTVEIMSKCRVSTDLSIGSVHDLLPVRTDINPFVTSLHTRRCSSAFLRNESSNGGTYYVIVYFRRHVTLQAALCHLTSDVCIA